MSGPERDAVATAVETPGVSLKQSAVVADTIHPRAVKVGDYVQVVPMSPLARGIGYLRQVLEVFVLEGVAFAVLTPKETTIPPIVPVDELVRVRLAATRTRATTAPR